MKIALVTQYFPPESNAPAVRSYEHAVEWVQCGAEVTVYTAFPHHPSGVIPLRYRRRILKRETTRGVRVVRSWVYATPNRGVVRRSASYLSSCLSAMTLGWAAGERPDVVVATSPQLLTAAAGYAMSRLWHVPFVFEMRDIWPESARELGALRSRAVLAPLLLLQRMLYRSAALFVINSEGFRDHVREFGISDERIVYVPNGISADFLELLDGTDAQSARDRLDLSDRFVVSYVGTHGMAHGLDTLLDAARQLQGEEDIQFILAGDGAERVTLEERAKRLNLGNVRFYGQQTRERIVDFYRASHLAVVPLRDLPMFRRVQPSKLFELFAAEVPVLCSIPGEAGRLVAESGGGVELPPEDAPALAAAVLGLRDDPARRSEMARSARDWVLREHDRTTLARRMLDELEKVVREGRKPR